MNLKRILRQVAVHGQVDDASAAAAHEVGVRGHHAVVVHIAAVDGERLHGIVRMQQLECVVDGGARQGGHGGKQVVIDSVDGGVGVVLHQVVHDGHALHRGSDAVFHKMLRSHVHSLVMITILK